MTDAAHETTANATETGDAVTHRDVWIPMPDGTPLHARVWAPATDEPVPALLEYLPYRLDDWTAPRDSERHPWYAAHGYASIRLDIRGTGSSDGLFVDEYSAQELDDGVAVIGGSPRRPGARAPSASSGSRGAASTACSSRPARRRP